MSSPSSSCARSVDVVWEEMQRDTLRADVSRLLRKSMASSREHKPHRAPAAKALAARVHKRCPQRTAEAIEPLAETAAAAEPFSLARELNRLADERPSVRRQAAAALETHLLRTTTGEEEVLLLPENTSFHDIAKPLFKRFNDPVEKVREVCIKLSTRLLADERDLLRVLPYMMPAVTARLASPWGYDEQQQVFTRDAFLHDAFKRGRVLVDAADHATATTQRLRPGEPSEEIRLLFLELLAALLRNAFARQASSLLHAYVFDVLLVLVAAVHDACPDANVRACALLVELCGHMVSVMKHFTVAFVRAAPRLLLHRLARVRVAAVHCVRALVLCPNFEKCKGSGSDAIVDLLGHRDENVIPIAAFYTGDVRLNCFARLGQDAHAGVRRAFYALVEDWMLHLPDRFDHESRLLPYLLSAVSDELGDVAQRALHALEQLGVRYEQEHGEEVLELKQYGVDGAHPSYNYRGKPLPAPFGSQRPPLGARLFVRARTRRFLHPILRELENWQSPTRSHAVRLLKCVLVYSEESVTVDAHALVHTLLKTWRRAPELAADYDELADLVGRFVEPTTFLPLLLARVRGDEETVGAVVSPASVAAALELLHGVVGGSLDRTLLPHTHEIVDALGSASVAAFETPRITRAHAQLVRQTVELLQRRGRDAVSASFLAHGRLTSPDRVLRELFDLALALAASPDDATAHCATAALSVLAQIHACASLAALCERHFDESFARAARHLESLSRVQWRPQLAPQRVVDQLLQLTATPRFLEEPSARTTLVASHARAMLDAAAADNEPSTTPPTARAAHYRRLLHALMPDAPTRGDAAAFSCLQSPLPPLDGLAPSAA